MDAEPNAGINWNIIVKRVHNWRLKWAVKLKRFVEEQFPGEFNAKPLSKEVELLLEGEDPYAAAAAAEAAEEDAKEEIKDEPGKPESFQPSAKFDGARPGFAFKLGPHGLGYYRDLKQEVKLSVDDKEKVKVEDDR